MLRLVELHVRKFRDLVDGGPLRFGPGPVFLLGPNGSGKTTLLELIGVLLGDDLGPLFKEEDAVELSWVLEAEGAGETPDGFARARRYLLSDLAETQHQLELARGATKTTARARPEAPTGEPTVAVNGRPLPLSLLRWLLCMNQARESSGTA